MTTENHPYHFNYQMLDQFLANDYDPQEVGNQLDEIMADLVDHAGKMEAYREVLPSRYYLMRELRDLFWKLPKA
jgi:hypothetical protein